MPSVLGLIQRLLPGGTRPDPPGTWDLMPLWPPDVFAVAAILVDRSGCYAQPHFAHGYPEGGPRCIFDQDGYHERIRRMVGLWRSNDLVELQPLWDRLIDPANGGVADHQHPEAASWHEAAMLLMMVADEAGAGMGFSRRPDLTPEQIERRFFADHYHEQYNLALEGKPVELPHLPHSLCQLVAPDEVCVQPKTTTAQAGCTLRSLSHHLALLPPIGEVKTTWRFAGPSGVSVLNLLAVPFPYHIHAGCLEPKGHCAGGEGSGRFDDKGNRSRFFDVRQDWLRNGGRALDGVAFADFLRGLIARAEAEVGAVHGVVLPELALTKPLAQAVASSLAEAEGSRLELFIAGVAYDDPASGIPRNGIFACTIDDRKYLAWTQNKHHRWKLERGQIRRYHLGSVLRPDYEWWERIDLSRRECEFRVFRRGASLAALVCEDLARIDPVQTVIRSIGPNLVIALLMDGPQRDFRWSAKYATVLADDPGSAVLSLTSLALVRRSSDPGRDEPREVALWKQPGGQAEELRLPRGSHALLLSLWPDSKTNFTLDGRSDRGNTMSLFLAGARAIQHPSPPEWAAVD